MKHVDGSQLMCMCMRVLLSLTAVTISHLFGCRSVTIFCPPLSSAASHKSHNAADTTCRYLSDDALQQVGAASQRCIELSCATVEAYLEEVSLLGEIHLLLCLLYMASQLKCDAS